MTPSEPVVSIGVVFTSLKIAVVSLLSVIAISSEWDPTMTGAVIGAGSAITLAVGDIAAWYLTRARVTSIAAPNLPIGTVINEYSDQPNGVVIVDVPPPGLDVGIPAGPGPRP